jgi:hypothetical protein
MIPSTIRTFQLLPAAAAASLALGSAWAAESAPAARVPREGETELRTEAADVARLVAQLGDETLDWVSREFRQERVVKGAPYCADAVHETVQPLADGNRIVQRQTTRLCRDGEGRTRQEVSVRDGRRTIYIRDPIAKENWVLDPERKTARSGTRIAIGPGGAQEFHFDTGAWRDYSERMREWARQMADRAKEAERSGKPGAAPGAPMPPAPPVAAPAPPAPVVISRSESSTGEVGGREQRQVEVQVLRIQDGTVPPPLPGLDTPPAVRLSARSLAPRGPGAVTALPPKEIEGVKVNGERTTWTIEAGQVGNEKPIVITREVWTSPELMLTVQTRDFDPRSGEVNYKLQNLQRGEPDAALFKVPADYATRPRPTPGAPGAPSAPARG